MTSDLQNQNWAVLSDRGCEATKLTHEEARRLVHRLEGEGRHGLCIVTAEAGSHVRAVEEAAPARGGRANQSSKQLSQESRLIQVADEPRAPRAS